MGEDELDDLAEAVGLSRDAAGRARLTEDALRTLRWIVDRQLVGETIVALRSADITLLARDPAVEGGRDCLVSYVVPGAQA